MALGLAARLFATVNGPTSLPPRVPCSKDQSTFSFGFNNLASQQRPFFRLRYRGRRPPQPEKRLS